MVLVQASLAVVVLFAAVVSGAARGVARDTNIIVRLIVVALRTHGAEVAEGFSAGVMPQDYEQKVSPKQLDDLVAFLTSG